MTGLDTRDLGPGRGWAVITPGHPGSSLGTWVLAGFTFEGWERVGSLYPWPSGLLSCHEGPVYVTHVSLTPVDVTLDLYASCHT